MGQAGRTGGPRYSSERPVAKSVTLPELGGVPRAAAFDQTGGRLAVVRGRREGAAGSDLRIWDVNHGKELIAIPLPGRQISEVMQSVAFSPDGALLAVVTAPVGPDASESLERGSCLGLRLR